MGEDRAAVEHYALAARTAQACGSPHLTTDAYRAAAEPAAAPTRQHTIVT
ncbi:hypothetical protein [Streptomyces brasiliscabiei]|nr:hypothetical protein [Streptomyces brasiliscabiei]